MPLEVTVTGFCFGRQAIVTSDTVLSIQPILEWNCVAVGKGLNCVVHPLVFPSENVFCGVKKAMGILSEEFAEEIW